MPTKSLLALALLLTACHPSDYVVGSHIGNYGIPEECNIDDIPTAGAAPIDTCVIEPTFDPILEWSAGPNRSVRGVPAVADLWQDGHPEIIAVFSSSLPMGKGVLTVLHGDGSGEVWSRDAGLAFATGATVGDVTGDGIAEILVVHSLGSDLPITPGIYTVMAYSRDGAPVWESAQFSNLDFDYATGISVADMDHDGNVEVVAGRVILNGADGSTRGVGGQGKGCYGHMPSITGGDPVTEGALSLVTDINLDGIDEVITGNAWYDPDGRTIWRNADEHDGMPAVANLDDDPEGEIVLSSFNTVRALDNDGTPLWGPLEVQGANIVSAPAIADLDFDGSPEILVAGGNQIVALHADGTQLWSHPATDESGATGASVFDFEGDGRLEVVYIDEVEIMVLDGATGQLKFHTTDHASDTMMDYPVIADVDADGHAEIIVGHARFTRGLSVFGDAMDSWAPARPLWNQHAYSMTNINDDLTVPTNPAPSFTTHNTWHAGTAPSADRVGYQELGAELVTSCDIACPEGSYYVLGRVVNHGGVEAPAGIPVSVYTRTQGVSFLLQTKITEEVIPAGTTGEVLTFNLSPEDLAGVGELVLRADDDGTGQGSYAECSEDDNEATLYGPFCP